MIGNLFFSHITPSHAPTTRCMSGSCPRLVPILYWGHHHHHHCIGTKLYDEITHTYIGRWLVGADNIIVILFATQRTKKNASIEKLKSRFSGLLNKHKMIKKQTNKKVKGIDWFKSFRGVHINVIVRHVLIYGGEDEWKTQFTCIIMAEFCVNGNPINGFKHAHRIFIWCTNFILIDLIIGHKKLSGIFYLLIADILKFILGYL